jgi:hypothetical protein
MATSITYPFDCFMGLQVDGVEVSGVGYVRRPATFEDIGDGVTAANVASVQWPACGSDWGFIDTVNLYDALTGGNLLCSSVATSVVRGNLYDELRVSAGGYQVYSMPAPLGFGTFSWGTGKYATFHSLTPPETVLLFRTFGSVALCGKQPGVWAPGPFDVVTAS